MIDDTMNIENATPLTREQDNNNNINAREEQAQMGKLNQFFLANPAINPRTIIRADVQSVMRQWLSAGVTADEIIEAVKMHDETTIEVAVSPKWYNLTVQRAIKAKRQPANASSVSVAKCGTKAAFVPQRRLMGTDWSKRT